MAVTVEKMLENEYRNGNGAVVQVEFKNLDSEPTLTEDQIGDIFWARIEDLKNGQAPIWNSRVSAATSGA